VRAEATDGLNKNRLAACFLHPTELIPPFTLTHAENLSAWAGQTDDPAWIKLLERQARAFLAENTCHHWHPITAAAREKFERLDAEAWLSARADGSEGEGAEGRLAREKAEARAAAEKRKAQAEKSRRLLQRGHEPVCAVPLRAYEVAFARGR
jgi:hypothetical protein